jgi:hypothetical protein
MKLALSIWKDIPRSLILGGMKAIAKFPLWIGWIAWLRAAGTAACRTRSWLGKDNSLSIFLYFEYGYGA